MQQSSLESQLDLTMRGGDWGGTYFLFTILYVLYVSNAVFIWTPSPHKVCVFYLNIDLKQTEQLCFYYLWLHHQYM